MSKLVLSEKFTFKVEIVLQDSVDELAKVVEGKNTLPVRISVGKFPLTSRTQVDGFFQFSGQY